jgi:hypothetical protein
MLAGLLQQLNLYIGRDLDSNNESFFFKRINDWLLTQANASWHNPSPIQYAPDYYKKLMVEIVSHRLNSFNRVNYLGFSKTLKHKSIRQLSFNWGWKDPRNTFTIDIWREIFPESKIIHIYRHPVDVVKSMYKREDEFDFIVKDNPSKTGLKKLCYGYKLPTRKLYCQPFKTLDYNGIFDLWKEYVSKALYVCHNNQDKIIHISYEEILKNPLEVLKRVVNFADLSLSEEDICNAANKINPQRRLAFLEDKSLREYYHQIKDDSLVRKLNYDNIQTE